MKDLVKADHARRACVEVILREEHRLQGLGVQTRERMVSVLLEQRLPALFCAPPDRQLSASPAVSTCSFRMARRFLKRIIRLTQGLMSHEG